MHDPNKCETCMDDPTRVPWLIDMTANIVRENSTRFVKRAPLGMHLTRDDGFRMVGGAS